MIPRHHASVVLILLCCVLMATWTATAIPRGLAEAPPKAVSLSGEWQFNPSLSDDARKIMAQRTAYLHERFERERRHHRRGPDVNDDLYNPAPFAPDKDFAQPFEVPVHISVAQSGSHVLIKATEANGDVNSEDYEAGAKSVTSFGTGYADRVTGWRDKAFIVSLRAAGEDRSKEERYALDGGGRLVVTTLFSGDGLPKSEIKITYDRVAS